MTRDWLKKPQSMLERKASTPEDAVSWLEGVFDQYAPKMAYSQATATSREDRFACALGALKGGTDLSWGFPLLGSKYLAVAIVVSN
ncbi:hypothetical protein J4573_15055 [Actinomadura barringtoniae]|uniref:Uncharacterized protein n=1 Tax=Actinomadura barringtoniae TaxID=1427535 RepID=A0A939T4M2_9ACTN|nr:hypothetical protein [Actinomadura barringtoniae]MBO2448419.1 hypothetical protein [Actinomadura barringtoniae]